MVLANANVLSKSAKMASNLILMIVNVFAQLRNALETLNSTKIIADACVQLKNVMVVTC